MNCFHKLPENAYRNMMKCQKFNSTKSNKSMQTYLKYQDNFKNN